MLTLAIIAKNEADRIGACLDSVPFASEKLVLDSGSRDGTVTVARNHGAVVVETEWPGHVVQKNLALQMAKGRWVLSLDADERLTPQAANALYEALQDPGDAVGFTFARCSHWQGKAIRHGKWYPDRKLRVVRAGAGEWRGDNPHDSLFAEGRVVDLSGDISHFPYRNFREHVRTIDRYTRISAESLHARGVRARWYDVAFRGPFHFAHAVVVRRGFLDGPHGIAVGALGAAYTGLKWSRLWRMGSR